MPSIRTPLIASIYFLILFPFLSSTEKSTRYENQITIRESTIDYQLRVGDRLFVFGKKSAGLEKIKVGMRMLDFYQQSHWEGSTYTLKWFRTKEASVVLQKWSGKILHSQWTLFPSGTIQYEKMNPAEDEFDLEFRFIEESLAAYDWQGLNQTGSANPKPIAEMSSKTALRFDQFDRLNLNFEDLSVIITPLELPVFALVLPNEERTRFNSIKFNVLSDPSLPSETPGQTDIETPPSKTLRDSLLKLNFEFY
ncbi:hypothetical protein [Algoriphagus sp.]|uniref:hypothetical protein n=1 Tax=Algoriphagus sp. TaxID=1872435 RepID=UPI00261E9BFA|nr:hypothetical protein [Algoriphagus sp.]